MNEEYYNITAKVRDAAVEAYREACTAAHEAEVAHSNAVAWAARTNEMKVAAMAAIVAAKEAVHTAEKQEQWAYVVPLEPRKV